VHYLKVRNPGQNNDRELLRADLLLFALIKRLGDARHTREAVEFAAERQRRHRVVEDGRESGAEWPWVEGRDETGKGVVMKGVNEF
jgi:hypothetical protein